MILYEFSKFYMGHHDILRSIFIYLFIFLNTLFATVIIFNEIEFLTFNVDSASLNTTPENKLETFHVDFPSICSLYYVVSSKTLQNKTS